MMWRAIVLTFICVSSAASAAAQDKPGPGPLFDRLVGHWVLTGTIDGNATTHDVDAETILNREYVQLHEVSREKDAAGRPEYEAIVLIGWDEKAADFACLWLDSTSGAGLASGIIAHGKPEGDTIPFVFKLANGDTFHTTFAYSRDSDTWRWIMDGHVGGKVEPFARVTLTRAR